MDSWPWWFVMVFHIFTIFATGRHTDTLYIPDSHPVEGCFVHVKVYEVKILADMGDGVFENDMEVQMVIGIGSDQESVEQVYPRTGYRNLEKGDSIHFDDFRLSVRAADSLQIYVLAIDIDERFRINGVNLGPSAFLLGSAARANLGPVGTFIDDTIRTTVSGFNNAFRSEDIIAEDLFIHTAEEGWGAGQRFVQRTNDGGLELTYGIALSGCKE